MFPNQVVESFRGLKTPFYYYDLDVLRSSLSEVKKYGVDRGYHVHFALKANHQLQILEIIKETGLGADCVSGGEIEQALKAGFTPSEIAFAGVGKSDDEIIIALSNDIFCFNCESPQELEVINSFAKQMGTKARVALRINPNVDADTHHYITTGLNENKFGIYEEDIEGILEKLPEWTHLELIGIHFHIGSQVASLDPFVKLCEKANDLNDFIEEKGFKLSIINVGGGFGINYESPNEEAVPDFEAFFGLFEKHIELKPHQQLHFELGRSIVGQSGSLITKVLYTKEGRTRNFAIVDAGMTELIRPALYQAKHRIDVLTSENQPRLYDVVGPICESSDTFRKGIEMPEVHRGDIIAIRSAGAYGEVMKSQYNLRPNIASVFSDDLS